MHISEEYVISMDEFLKNYVLPDSYDEQLCKNINHLDITELNLPNVKRIAYKYVTMEDILTGRVLLVRAKSSKKRKEIWAYVRPEIEKERKIRSGKF